MRDPIEGYLDLAHAVVVCALKDALGVGPTEPTEDVELLQRGALQFLGGQWGAFLCNELGWDRETLLVGLGKAARDLCYRQRLATILAGLPFHSRLAAWRWAEARGC
jgi:hypothetical protein